jgi:hypothetical protein
VEFFLWLRRQGGPDIDEDAITTIVTTAAEAQ